MLRRPACALLALGFASTALRADDPRPDDDSKRLQGTWQAVECRARGKKSGRDDAEVRNMRMVFQGDEMLIPVPGAEGGGRRKVFKLDPSKALKELDLISLDGQEKGQTAACVYKLDGDRLTICLPYFHNDPGRRPKAFEAAEDDGQMVIVLERSKPK